MTSSTNHRVKRLFAQRRDQLLDFFRRQSSLRSHSADLTQEAFLRLLRADEDQAIHNPEAYLFTVASNLAREHYLLQSRFADAATHDDPLVEAELANWPDIDHQLDADARQSLLLKALDELSPKCRAAVVLQYCDGLSYQQIGERLGVSSHMVKKYLSNALQHCRKRLVQEGE